MVCIRKPHDVDLLCFVEADNIYALMLTCFTLLDLLYEQMKKKEETERKSWFPGSEYSM